MRLGELTLPTAAQYRADTAGWDCVNCVRITEINEAIRNAGTSPREFEIALDGGAQVAGRFDAWQIAQGGDGPLVNLSVPIHDVVVTRGEARADLERVVADIQVRLEFIPSGLLAAGPEPTRQQLLVVAGRPSRLMLGADGAERAATLIQVEGDAGLSIRLKAALHGGLERWFNENLDAFAHVFAAVNLSQRISEETEGVAFAWLKPTEVGYAFGQAGTDPDASVLAILCQTEGRRAEGLVHQADPGLIPPGCKAGVCISRTRFLRNMIGAALPNAFKGLSARDIVYADKDTGLGLRAPVRAERVQHDGKSYDPVIQRLDVRLRDTEMELHSVTRTEISPGIFSVCVMTAAYAFGLMPRPDGAKTIGFVQTRVSKPIWTTEKTAAVTILDVILQVVAAVSGLVIVVFSAGLGAWAAGICAALLLGSTLGTVSIKIIDMVGRGEGPPVDLLMANATGAVQWCSNASFDPTFAALNNGLQIGGVLRKGAARRGAAALGGKAYHAEFQQRHAPVMAARRKR